MVDGSKWLWQRLEGLEVLSQGQNWGQKDINPLFSTDLASKKKKKKSLINSIRNLCLHVSTKLSLDSS